MSSVNCCVNLICSAYKKKTTTSGLILISIDNISAPIKTKRVIIGHLDGSPFQWVFHLIGTLNNMSIHICVKNFDPFDKVHYWHTQLPCTQGSEPYVPNGCSPLINRILNVPSGCIHKIYITASVSNSCVCTLMAYPTILYPIKALSSIFSMVMCPRFMSLFCFLSVYPKAV